MWWLDVLMVLYDVSFIGEHNIGINCYIYGEEHAWYENEWNVYIAYSPLLGLFDYVELWGFT